MSFKFLGKKPPESPKRNTGTFHEPNLIACPSLKREEHFRGALKEAAQFISSWRGKTAKDIAEVTILKNQIERMLRLSAGEP